MSVTKKKEQGYRFLLELSLVCGLRLLSTNWTKSAYTFECVYYSFHYCYMNWQQIQVDHNFSHLTFLVLFFLGLLLAKYSLFWVTVVEIEA